MPGLTEVAGRPRLPRRPESVAALLRLATDGEQTWTQPGLVEATARATGEDRTRLAGLAGWLPATHVVAWDADGTLRRHPATSAADLGARFRAWTLAQVDTEEQVALAEPYADAVVEALETLTEPVGGEGWTRIAGQGDADDAERDDLTRRVQGLLTALDAAFLERGTQVRAVVLALLAGRHALLVGPPGTAKSMLARAVCACFKDARYFEYLLSRFTHPDELFGPVSIPGLKDEDYRRLTEGFLPQAHVAFLDEVFKANSAILNSLLTLVNERLFHHGRHRDPAPLIGLVGASNELPDPEGGLGALYDRFLVRLAVPALADPDAFLAVATSSVSPPALDPDDALTLADLAELRARATAVEVPGMVRQALLDVWQVARESGWTVSDRRWRQGVQMLQVGAAAEGRRRLELLDLLLLEPVLAPDPSRSGEVREVLLEQVAPRAVPRDDLDAQWRLLAEDRVAPLGDEDLDLGPGEDLDDRLARRRRHADRVVAHAEAAVSRLAADRHRIEQGGGGRLWVGRVPSRILSAHIETARRLSRVLEQAEAYRADLGDVPGAVHAMIDSLPAPERRAFGAGVALRLRVPDADIEVGLTLTAERVAPPDPETPERRRSVEAELFERAPELVANGLELVGFLRGELDAQDLVQRLPIHAYRNAGSVLTRLRRRLGDTGVPAPPPLPR